MFWRGELISSPPSSPSRQKKSKTGLWHIEEVSGILKTKIKEIEGSHKCNKRLETFLDLERIKILFG